MKKWDNVFFKDFVCVGNMIPIAGIKNARNYRNTYLK